MRNIKRENVLAILLTLLIYLGIPLNVGYAQEVLVSDVISSHMFVKDDYLFWSDSSVTPIKKIHKTGGSITPLTINMGVPYKVEIQNQHIFWIDSQSGGAPSGCVGPGVRIVLNKTSLDGTVTERLALGDGCSGTANIVIDDSNVYWVNSTSSPNTYTIKNVPVDGGTSTTLVSTLTPIMAMARDAAYLYWIEQQFPEPGVIKKMPLGGGQITTVFTSDFNPLNANFAVNGTNIIFADLP